MKPHISAHFDGEIHKATEAMSHGDWAGTWHHLERAHVLSQAYAWPHTYVHLRMLRVAIQRRNPKEILGQILRVLVAAPGSWLGRAPKGNTGGANVGILQPMAIPEDLRRILEE